MEERDLILHASCIAFEGKGVLIFGPSGSGKSALALELMAFGAELVADDRTIVVERDGRILASSPSSIAGLIEARGVGILTVPNIESATVQLVVDLSRIERERMPERYTSTVLDIPVPCLHKVDAPYFPAAIIARMRGLKIET